MKHPQNKDFWALLDEAIHLKCHSFQKNAKKPDFGIDVADLLEKATKTFWGGFTYYKTRRCISNKLHVIDGPHKGQPFNLNDDITTIGRFPDNDIRISDKGVSRHHGKFLKKDDKIFVVDLRSLQGLFIDGEKIEPGQEVEIKKESNLLIRKNNSIIPKGISRKKIG